MSIFDGIDRSRLAGVTLDASGTTMREAFEEAVRLIVANKPSPPCGSFGNPHLISPRPVRWPVCVTCGAGAFDAALAADMESRGVDTSRWPNIAGELA